MAIQFKVPYRDYEELRSAADGFLNKHHRDGSIPVPIETIIDNNFEVDIIPVPGLAESIETVAFLSSDLTSIYIDEFVYEKRPTRYRFSLAHELAHVIIHRDCYKVLRASSINDWKIQVSELPPREYGWMEWQANCLAGLILAPARSLQQSLERAKATVASVGLSLTSERDAARDMVFRYIADEFQVSSQVIEKRVEFDKLLD